MNKLSLFIFKLIMVFIFCTAFISTDTIIKGNVFLHTQPTDPVIKPQVTKAVNADSLLVVAKQNVESYNKSVEVKTLTDIQLLEQNKKLLKYEKEENKLIREVILKFKQQLKDSKNKEEIVDISAKLDSVCVRYKNPLFGKKVCIEYSKVYTIIKDGKEIKLKEIK